MANFTREYPGTDDTGQRGYERLRSMSPEQSPKFRDVYNSKGNRILPVGASADKPRSVKPWYIGAGATGASLLVGFWLVFTLGQMMASHVLATMWGGPLSFWTAMPKAWALKLLFGVLLGGGVGGAIALSGNRMVTAYNATHTDNLLGAHDDDAHVQFPEEVADQFHPFPNAGAHSSVEANALVSCMMVSTHGVKKVAQTRFHDKDVLDEHGAIIAFKGSPVLDAEGNIVTDMVPIIDERFADKLWDASGLPDDKTLRKRFDPKRMPYGRNIPDREKVGKGAIATWADLINEDWEYPDYEVQRPSGVYMVDSAPINTMLLAITRAGKGQTYIEPQIDMWTREKRHRNIMVNDPKGELLFKFFVPLLKRGFNVNSFNLMSPAKTDIYNPIWMAANAARRGDMQKCGSYISAIADAFFPTEGQDDPMWPNAAANAFKRAAFGLIDYYLEEEAEILAAAREEGRTYADVADEIDRMWGHVTLYNCYEFFVILAGKKVPNPLNEYNARLKAGEYPEDEPEAQERAWRDRQEAEKKGEFWGGQAEADMFTIYFNATRTLWQNSIRTLLGNADSSLRAMAGSDKTIASVYGITLTAMNFFTDPTISTLTSGRPSQTLDLASLSFPRRIAVRFARHFLDDNDYAGMQCIWQAYADRDFTRSLGKAFHHNDTVDQQGWARMFFDGVFPHDKAYLKLDVYNPSTEMTLETLYFQFTKGYRRTYDETRFMVDPVNHERIAEGGTLIEMIPAPAGAAHAFMKGTLKYPDQRLIIDPVGGVYADASKFSHGARMYDAVMQTDVSYTEKAKAIFFVTPPHLKMYAKLILILIRQMFDLSVESSYMAKENQKPLYTTSYMLDELGNLESEGHGINGFQTMLSIGLGQSQQFTLILQSLQQLKDVYGDSVDKIISGNAQPLDAMVATPTGFKAMGVITIGDDILLRNGGISTVTGVYPKGVRPVYRIIRRDGTVARACNQHLWKVKIRKPERR